MASDPEVFKGIILKTSEYKEKDRMIQVLTRERGIVNICVKGVSGKTSKVSFVSLPYSYCDFTVTDSHGFYYLKEGNVISGNTGIMDSLEAMAVAGHISECLCWSVMQSENARDVYELAIYSYYALSADPSSFLTVMIAFNWKLLWLLGLATKTADCISSAENSVKLNRRGMEILDYIGVSSVSKIFTVVLEEDDIRQLRPFTLEYLRIQFERDIPDPVLKLGPPL